MQYSFKCSICNKIFDVVGDFKTVTFSDLYCPDCGSKDVNRKYSLNFILKGKGWSKEKKNE